MTTQKQPEPLPEFEPFDTERARAGEELYNEYGDLAKEYFVFQNGEVVVLWLDESRVMIYTENTYYYLRHKRKAKPIEFENRLAEYYDLSGDKPSDFDTVELIGTIDDKDFMKATTKGKATAYYLGKFNDGALK